MNFSVCWPLRLTHSRRLWGCISSFRSREQCLVEYPHPSHSPKLCTWSGGRGFLSKDSCLSFSGLSALDFFENRSIKGEFSLQMILWETFCYQWMPLFSYQDEFVNRRIFTSLCLLLSGWELRQLGSNLYPVSIEILDWEPFQLP